MADFQTIEAGTLDPRGFTMVKRADGSPITTGTVNYYLKALTGPNVGKWWQASDNTWHVAETANAMTYESADAEWTLYLTASPFAAGAAFLEYARESGNLHVPQSRRLKADYTPFADSAREVRVPAGVGAGNGDTGVDQNTGGTDNLRFMFGATPIEGATIKAYLAADWAAGQYANVQGASQTGPDGRWLWPMFLSHGFTYTIAFFKPGSYQTSTASITI